MADPLVAEHPVIILPPAPSTRVRVELSEHLVCGPGVEPQNHPIYSVCLCCLCNDMPMNPTLCGGPNEGHIICGTCRPNLRLDKCPMCRSEVPSLLSRPAFPPTLKRIVNNMIVKCPQCPWHGNWGWEGKEFTEHLEKRCPERIIVCKIAGCSAFFVASTVAEHERTCPYQPTECLLCHQTMPGVHLPTHECPEAMLPCPHTTAHKIARKELATHIETCEYVTDVCSLCQWADSQKLFLDTEVRLPDHSYKRQEEALHLEAFMAVHQRSLHSQHNKAAREQLIKKRVRQGEEEKLPPSKTINRGCKQCVRVETATSGSTLVVRMSLTKSLNPERSRQKLAWNPFNNMFYLYEFISLTHISILRIADDLSSVHVVASFIPTPNTLCASDQLPAGLTMAFLTVNTCLCAMLNVTTKVWQFYRIYLEDGRVEFLSGELPSNITWTMLRLHQDPSCQSCLWMTGVTTSNGLSTFHIQLEHRRPCIQHLNQTLQLTYPDGVAFHPRLLWLENDPVPVMYSEHREGDSATTQPMSIGDRSLIRYVWNGIPGEVANHDALCQGPRDSYFRMRTENQHLRLFEHRPACATKETVPSRVKPVPHSMAERVTDLAWNPVTHEVICISYVPFEERTHLSFFRWD